MLATLVVLAPLFSDLPKAVLARDHHRRGRVRDDRRRASSAASTGSPASTSGSRWRRSSPCCRPAYWPASSSAWCCRSGGWCTWRRARRCRSSGREAGTQVFRDLDEHPDDETLPGVAVLRFDGGLFFATAESLENRVRADRRTATARSTALVLDLEGVNFIDSQGAAALAEVHDAPRGRRRRPAPREAPSRRCCGCWRRTGSSARIGAGPRPPQPAPGGRGAARGTRDRRGDVMGTEDRIVPRWEWRTFDEVGAAPPRASRRSARATSTTATSSTWSRAAARTR